MTGEELIQLQDQMAKYILFNLNKAYGMNFSVFVSGYTMEVILRKGQVIPPEMLVELMNPAIDRRDLLVPPYPTIKQTKPNLWKIILGKRERSQ